MPGKFVSFLRVGFAGCVVALAVLALLPARLMTRTGLGGHSEHLIAYLGTTIIMGLAFQKSPRLAVQCVLLVMYAAILEAGQFMSPGRHASFLDLAVSSTAILLGGLFLWLTRRLSLPKTPSDLA